MARKFTTDEIFNTATSAEGMNKRDRAMFHAFNPNGACASLPTDFSLPGGAWATGIDVMYSRHSNFHAEQIKKFATAKHSQSFTCWDLEYHVRKVLEDAARVTAVMEEKREEYQLEAAELRREREA